jgi:predicted transcriptional regulator
MSTVREEAHKLVDQLPDEASWDDLMYQIYVHQKVDAGRQAIAEGRLFSQEEAEKRMAKWLDEK